MIKINKRRAGVKQRMGVGALPLSLCLFLTWTSVWIFKIKMNATISSLIKEWKSFFTQWCHVRVIDCGWLHRIATRTDTYLNFSVGVSSKIFFYSKLMMKYVLRVTALRWPSNIAKYKLLMLNLVLCSNFAFLNDSKNTYIYAYIYIQYLYLDIELAAGQCSCKVPHAWLPILHNLASEHECKLVWRSNSRYSSILGNTCTWRIPTRVQHHSPVRDWRLSRVCPAYCPIPT